MIRWLTIVVLYGLWLAPAQAHKASDAYGVLNVSRGEARVQLSLAVKDLDAAIDTLDADNNREVSWGEIDAAMPVIAQRIGQDLGWQCAGQAFKPTWRFESLEQRSDGAYVRLASALPCAQASQLRLNYAFMQGLDPTHRLIIVGTIEGRSMASVLSDQQRELSLTETTAQGSASMFTSGWVTLAHFFPEGMHHIITGYDHLAFLLALLLPIRLRRRAQTSHDGVKQHGFGMLVSTVTAFTIGHSITLVMATLGLIASPSWVEPAIVITIAASALLNLWPVRWLRSDVLALGFGLIHGLGFSSIMREAGVSAQMLPWALGGFNLGVEAGQLIGVGVWCLCNLLIGSWLHYQRVVVQGGSVALACLAMYWLYPMLFH
jgi:hypothetical protein